MASPAAALFPTFVRPYVTQTAATVIQSLIQPLAKKKAKILTLKYTDGGTAHTLTFMRPLGPQQKYPAPGTPPLTGIAAGQGGGNAYATAAVAASGTALILNRDPGSYAANFLADGVPGPLCADNLIAANDYLVIETSIPGQFYASKISAATTNSDGTVTVTLSTAAPTGGIPIRARIFYLGITTDTDPRTNEAHPTVVSGASSATVTYGGDGSPVQQTLASEEPILINSNNATGAGFLNTVSGIYADA